MQARLIGAGGATVGQSFGLGPETTIGRDASNAIVLNDSTVSRNHARIQQDPAGFTLYDLGSSNGTTLNGAPVSTPLRVGHGDEIAFGSVLFRLDVAQPAAKQQETSSREAGFGQPSAMPTDAPGCLPGLQGLTGDVGSIASWIARLLPWLLVILLALFILSLILKIGSALFSHDNSSPDQASASSGSTSPSSQPPPPQRQPPQQQAQEQQGETVNLQIVSATLVSVDKASIELLVTWKNGSQQPIKELEGDIVEPESGVVLQKDVAFYKGQPVNPGEEHADLPGAGTAVSLPSDTVALPQKVELQNLRAK